MKDSTIVLIVFSLIDFLHLMRILKFISRVLGLYDVVSIAGNSFEKQQGYSYVKNREFTCSCWTASSRGSL